MAVLRLSIDPRLALDKAVSDTKLGKENMGRRRIAFDFLAQFPDEDA